VATHGGELEGTLLYKTPNFNFALCNTQKGLLYRQNLLIDVNIFSQFSCFNFRYISNCILLSCFAFSSNIVLPFLTQLGVKNSFKM